MTGAATPTPAPRRHRLLVAVLVTVAAITGLFGVVAVWLNRQALNTDNWTQTSGKLLADAKVQKAVSAFMVDQLFTSVDVPAEVQKVLPPQAKALAGPAAAGLQELAGRAAPRLIASPKVQDAWRLANRTAHAELMRSLNGGSGALTTTGGDVVLNLRPLVDRLAASLGIQEQVAAVRSKLQGSAGATARGVAQQKLGVTLPPSSGRIVIMRSGELKTAQDVSNVVRHLAVVLTALALVLFAGAIAVASGWRRVVLRRTGWCFIGIGLFVLLVRRVGGNALVDSLVKSDANKPAVHDVWTIGTTLLYDIGIAMFAYGVVFVLAAWLAGPTRAAVAVRRALAPALRYRLASVYGVLALAFLLVVVWGPTAAFRKPLGVILFAALLALGVEVLRRQIARERPDVKRGETADRMRAWMAGASGAVARRRSQEAAPASDPAIAVEQDRVADLERLAALHDRGVLSDDEFDHQKVLILNGS